MKKFFIGIMLIALLSSSIGFADTTNPYDSLPEVGTQGVMDATIEYIFNDSEILVRDNAGQLYNIHITDETIINSNLENIFVISNEITVNYTITAKSIVLQADANSIDYHAPDYIGDIEANFVGKLLAFVDDDSILLENPITSEQALVHLSDDTVFTIGVSTDLQLNNYVVVQYNGIATESIPMQINALAITYNDEHLPSHITGLYYLAANDTLTAYFHVDDLTSYDVIITNVNNQQRWLKYLDPATGSIKYTAKVNVDDYSVFMITSSQAYDALLEEYMPYSDPQEISSKDLYDYKYSKIPLTQDECESLIYQFIAQSPYQGKSITLIEVMEEKVFDSPSVEYYVFHYQTPSGDQTKDDIFIKIDAYMGLVTEVTGDL